MNEQGELSEIEQQPPFCDRKNTASKKARGMYKTNGNIILF